MNQRPFAIKEAVTADAESTVYRAAQRSDGSPVLLKVLERRPPEARGLAQLENELNVAGTLDGSKVSRLLSLATHQGMPALIREDFGGIPLDRFLTGPLSVPNFLELAIAMTGALEYVHQIGLVHKELRESMAREREARTAAERAVQLRDEFLSVASHELRTPLTSLELAIFGITRRIGSKASDKIQHNRTLTLRIGSPVLGTWDGARMEQIVINLLSNAIKFGQGRPIEVTLEARNGMARLSVLDHGMGIPQEFQEHVFDRFGRGVSARHYGGLGLGLYIVRTIAEAHGGRVSFTSALGKGARFSVEIPQSLASPKAEEAVP